MSDATLSVKLVGDAKGLTGSIVASKKALSTLRREVSGTTRALKRFGHYGSVYFAARETSRLLTFADSYRVLEKRIEAATRASGNYQIVSEKIHAIANANGVAVESTVGLYQAISRVRSELGATDDEILTVTSALQQAGVVGGSSTAQMTAGMMQFSQAMAAGIVRAEEMNSIVENMPEAAAAIASGMGMTVGELQRAVREGKVLSRDVFQALIDQAPELQQRFDAFGTTLSMAGTEFKDSLGVAVVELDKALGLTQAIAREFKLWSRELRIESGHGSLRDLGAEIERLRGLRTDGWHDSTGVVGLFGVNRAALETRISNVKRQLGERLRQQDMRYRMTQIEDEIAITERRLKQAERVGSAVAQSLRDKLGRLNGELKDAWDQLVQQELGPELPATQPGSTSAGNRKITQLKAYLDGLREERATLNMTTEELARYKAAKLGADEASQALAARLAGEIAHEKALNDALDEAIAQQEAMEQAYDARMQADQGLVATLERELSLMKLSDRERAIEINLRKLSLDATGAQRQKVRELTGAIYDQAEAARRAAKAQADLAEQNRRAMQRIESAVTASMSSAEDAFVKFVRTGKLEFADLVNSMLEQMLRLQFEQSIAPGLNSLLGGLFNGLFGPSAGAGAANEFALFDQVPFETIGVSGINPAAALPFGDGGVMTPAGPLPLERYGTGGVVNRPQLRLAGERYQPEAIVPLPDGRSIPVDLRGRQPVVVNVIEAPGRGGEVRQRNDGGQQVIEVFVEQVKAAVAGDIASGRGPVPQAMERTYGLNRAAGAY